MFSIRMVIRQVRRVGKLVRNVKPIVYPVSSVLFASCILSNKSWKNMESGQEPQEPLNLEHKLSFEHKINSITADAVHNALETLGITAKFMINLNIEYRTLLEKLISVHKEILDSDINDISDTKLDSLLELRNEIRTKKEQIELMLNYIFEVIPLINDAVGLSTLCTIGGVDSAAEQLTRKVWDKLREEDKNNSELEQAYWHVQQQCIEKTKDMSTGLKFFNILFRVDKLIRVNFSKQWF